MEGGEGDEEAKEGEDRSSSMRDEQGRAGVCVWGGGGGKWVGGGAQTRKGPDTERAGTRQNRAAEEVRPARGKEAD